MWGQMLFDWSDLKSSDKLITEWNADFFTISHYSELQLYLFWQIQKKNKGPNCLPYNWSYPVFYFDTDVCCVQSTEAVGDWRKNIEDKADRKKMFETSWTLPTIKSRLMFPLRSSDSLSVCHLTEFKHFGSFSFGSFVDSIHEQM